jgi:hypothetical protein
MSKSSNDRIARRVERKEWAQRLEAEMRRMLFPEQPYEREWFAEIIGLPTVTTYLRRLSKHAMFHSDCHTNAWLYCDVHRDHQIVHGWMADEGLRSRRALVHSVVKHTASGTHYDVTPTLQARFEHYAFTPDPDLIVPYYDTPAPKGSRPGISRHGITVMYGVVRENPVEFIAQTQHDLRDLRRQAA